jgi:hypothetical protein
MRQSSHLIAALPACAVLLGLTLCAAQPLPAQQRYRVLSTENLRREPSGRAALLATVNAGVELRADTVEGRWARLTLEGWVWAQSLEPTSQPGYDLRVAPTRGENLRAGPNGRVLARLAEGCLLEELDREPGWVRVRRVAWMFGGSLQRVDAGAPASTQPAPAAARPQSSQPGDALAGLDRAVTADRAGLFRTPDGDSAGVLAADAPVRVLTRSGEWVRVQTEGWVRESDLRPSSAGVLVGVSGAEVRSRPQEFEGRLLQWAVQYIAIQRADELRSEIPEGQRYLLARGPLPEAGFVYVVLDDAQLEEVERLEPLAELVIIGRVRTARSQYLGNPVLDLVDMAVRRE